MISSSARVRTDRASRYLSQLCRHGSRMGTAGSHRPPGHGHDGTAPAARAEWSGNAGVIDFASGRCTLQATGDTLILRAEAETCQQLQRIQDGIAARLQRIGRRDGLTVTWLLYPSRTGSAMPAAGSQGGAPADAAPRGAAAIVDALLTPAGRADPFPLYAAAHQLGPVGVISDGWYLIAGYAAVSQALRDPGFGLPEPGQLRPAAGASGGADALRSLSRSILRANPPDHARMRSLISQVFTPRRVAELAPAIEEATDGLLDRLAETGAHGSPVDFMDQFACPLPVTVICELLGVPPADRDRFRPLAADLTQALELSADPSAAADAAARELAGYFTRLIDERRADPRDDLIGALISVRDAGDGRLTEQELLANLITLLVAGFETTTSLLGNGLAILLDRPGLALSLSADAPATAAFVEEVLRYDSPVQVTTRTARADDLTVAGVPVPRGSQAILLIGAANRDPARYPDPGKFDPARRDIKPLSFGAGAHVCIGNALARLEAAIAFPRLLARFPALAAATGQQRQRRDRLVLRGYETLPVIVTPPR